MNHSFRMIKYKGQRSQFVYIAKNKKYEEVYHSYLLLDGPMSTGLDCSLVIYVVIHI